MDGMNMNGMDMDGMDMGAMRMGNMSAFLHFSPTGDTLWFSGWAPARTGPMVGACIGLFFLAVFERWLAACRALAERSWARSAQIAFANRLNAQTHQLPTSSAPMSSKDASDTSSAGASPNPEPSPPSLFTRARNAPPFMLANDSVRAAIHIVQTALGFAFMLVLMTFQVGFILALVMGAGVGEMLFGRYATPLM